MTKLGEHTQPGTDDLEYMCPGPGSNFHIHGTFIRNEPHDRRYKNSYQGQIGKTAPLWPRCWKCNSSLGCAMCTTTNIREVMCVRCIAWGTNDAFQHHGPFINNNAAKLHQYPEDWRKQYDPKDLS